jgi:hypothetical protein
MTELHVQRKRHSLTWVWALVILVIIAGLIFLYLRYKDPKVFTVPNKSQTSIKKHHLCQPSNTCTMIT